MQIMREQKRPRPFLAAVLERPNQYHSHTQRRQIIPMSESDEITRFSC